MKLTSKDLALLFTVLLLIVLVTMETYPTQVWQAVSTIKESVVDDVLPPLVRTVQDSNESTSGSREENKTLLEILPRLPEDPDDEFMKLQGSIQEARKQHLRNMCQKYNLNASNPVQVARKTKEFLVDDKHKLVMCVTAKNAGKSWKKVLNVLAGYANSTSEQVDGVKAVDDARNIRRLSSYTPEEIQFMFKEYTFFMFSRHPLTRTLSAYNNLLSPNATERVENIWRLGYQIIKRYRPMAESSKTNNDLSFPEFVRYLVDQKMPKQLRSHTDNHWIENYKFCHPCDIPYTVIGRYETLLEDAKYILKLTKVDDQVSFPETEGPKATSTHSSNFKKMMSFYEQVPLGDLQKLIKRYELDYLLFNYTLPTQTGRNKWLGF